jgi:Fe2+ or Zn2+ uptake regulation protein
MNKYQRFAVNHYLVDYDDSLSFEDIVSALQNDDIELITVSELYDSVIGLSYEEIADNMYQMAADLESLL